MSVTVRPTLQIVENSEYSRSKALLIEFVYLHPELYDPRNESYCDTTRKNALWAEIGQELNKNDEWGKLTWAALVHKYKTLRKMVTSRNQNQGRARRWVYFNAMGFLAEIADEQNRAGRSQASGSSSNVSRSTARNDDGGGTEYDNETEVELAERNFNPTTSQPPTTIPVQNLLNETEYHLLSSGMEERAGDRTVTAMIKITRSPGQNREQLPLSSSTPFLKRRRNGETFLSCGGIPFTPNVVASNDLGAGSSTSGSTTSTSNVISGSVPNASTSTVSETVQINLPSSSSNANGTGQRAGHFSSERVKVGGHKYKVARMVRQGNPELPAITINVPDGETGTGSQSATGTLQQQFSNDRELENCPHFHFCNSLAARFRGMSDANAIYIQSKIMELILKSEYPEEFNRRMNNQQ